MFCGRYVTSDFNQSQYCIYSHYRSRRQIGDLKTSLCVVCKLLQTVIVNLVQI